MDFISAEGIVKQYDGHLALDHVDLHVPKGCVYGLLGPNGAGKSSLIRIINRITHQDEGTLQFDGHPITDADVANIGYLPEERGLYKKMKVMDEIVYLARLKGMDRNTAMSEARMWLDRFDLGEWAGRKVETLSKGMQQKVQFIATVIHKPQLLIFDEPFSGFDPINADQLKREILRLNAEGATILFSTHNMESVEAVCQQISLINRAHVVLQGGVDEIKQRFKKSLYSIALDGNAPLPEMPELYSIESREHASTIVRLKPGVERRSVIEAINAQLPLAGFSELLPSMHEIFVETVQSTQSAPPPFNPENTVTSNPSQQ